MADLKTSERKFRPELEGVRAVAALLVAVYHIWLGRVSGGVDVFFIVSGYLITTSLLSRIIRDDKIKFGEYYLGLARRLFPLAYTVIFVSTILSIFILPITVWTETIPEAFASIFYYENWQLAWNTVDYLAQNNEAGPFQHFWALSLQGQFYFTWPILITLVYFISRKVLKTPVRKTLLAILIILFITSLSYSIYLTNVNQPFAYFNTFARVWEFSLGGILALVLPYLKPTKMISFFLGWIGLLTIVLTGILLPVSTMFPGYVALIPVGGVLLVIISAENGSRFGADYLLGTKPFMYLGSISYGFYLWHWPMLIFYYALFNTSEVSFFHGLILMIISFVLSVLSVRFIEKPVRSLSIKTDKKKIMKYVGTFSVLVIVGAGSWFGYVTYLEKGNMITSIEDYPGARSISNNVVPTEGMEPYPDLLTLKKELPDFYGEPECYSSMNEGGDVKECSYGETEDYDLTIALIGGSHSGHWFPALEAVALKSGIKMTLLNKDACRFSNDDFEGLLTEACMEWNDNVSKYLKENPVDIIFTTANVGSNGYVPEGYLTKWAEFEGISEVFAIRDNPWAQQDTPACLEENPKKPEVCGAKQSEVLSPNPPWEDLKEIPENVTFADLTPYFCDGEFCPSIIGNVIVYRDNHHLGTYYSETLSEALEEALLPLVNELRK